MTGTSRGRLIGLDVARCLALLGMVATHVLDERTPGGDLTTAQWLAGGRASALFAVLAGVSLALMEAHWNEPNRVFELACGTGPYLRELSRRGVQCCGGDVVFAKLWLARHWVVGPDVELICFDAASPWPISGCQYDMVLCHDAFYFLEPKDDNSP